MTSPRLSRVLLASLVFVAGLAGCSHAGPKRQTGGSTTTPPGTTRALGSCQGDGAPGGPAAPGQLADAFVNSIGINVHLGKHNGAYADAASTESAVRYLGVHHLRDVIQPHNATQIDELSAFASAGVDADLIVNDPNAGTIAQRLTIARGLLGSGLASLEGVNEYDGRGGSSWPATLRGAQGTLASAVRHDPAFNGVTVVAPALRLTTDPAPLGDLSSIADVGNLHAYPLGKPPEENVEGELGRGHSETRSKPIWVTESGYHGLLSWTGGHRPASVEAVATYIPRLVAEYYRVGIARTFIYELVDDTSTRGNQAHFGLFNADFSPKPAAVALANIVGILSDPGATTAPCPAPISITGQPTDLHDLVLVKRDGRTEVLLWRAEKVWDPASSRPLSAASTNITLKATGRTISLYEPAASKQARRLGVGTVSVPVGPNLVIAEVTASSSP